MAEAVKKDNYVSLSQRRVFATGSFYSERLLIRKDCAAEAAAYVVGPVSGGKISLMKGPIKVVRPPAYLQTRYRVNLRVNLGEFRLPIYH